MVSGSLAPLYFFLGQSPIEWGGFLLVRSFVRPYVFSPSAWASDLADGASDLAGWASGPARWLRDGVDGRTNKRTNEQKISSFYRTLSPIGAAAQKEDKEKNEEKKK